MAEALDAVRTMSERNKNLAEELALTQAEAASAQEHSASLQSQLDAALMEAHLYKTRMEAAQADTREMARVSPGKATPSHAMSAGVPALELDFAGADGDDDGFTDLAADPPGVNSGAEESKGSKDEEELAASHAEIMRIVHSEVASAEDPSTSVQFDPAVEASPTGSLALSAAKSYKVGQERVDAIEAREHEHLDWQRHHYGDEGLSEPDFGGPDDLIGDVTDLYPGASDGPRILLARKCYVMLRGRRPGLYGTWEECERETSGFKSSEYSTLSGVLALEKALAYWRLKLWRVASMAPSTPATDPALVSLSSAPLRTTPPSSSRPSDHSPVFGLGCERLHCCRRDATGVGPAPSTWHPSRAAAGACAHVPPAGGSTLFSLHRGE